MKTTITHGTCGIEMTRHTDYIGVRNSDGAFLGNIFGADPAGDWEKIADGACPICDGWEDGNGHACTAYGWELEDPNFATGHGVANLVEGGWKDEDRDALKAEFGLSDFEADAYAQAIAAATPEGGKQEMTINYDSVAYGSNVYNGKVKYYEEYSLNGRIVYTVNITYKDYIEATGRKIRK